MLPYGYDRDLEVHSFDQEKLYEWSTVPIDLYRLLSEMLWWAEYTLKS